MSDGSLSQDEIDALLQGTDSISMDMDMGVSTSPFSDQDRDILKNMLDSVVESQSSNLSMLTSQTAVINKPTVSLKTRDQVLGMLSDNVVEIKMDFTDGIRGEHLSYFTEPVAVKVASMMLGQDGIELNEMALSTIGEAVSNILGPTTTALGNKINATVKTSPPMYQKVNKRAAGLPQGESVVVVEYPLSIGGESSKIIDVYSLPLAKEISSMISRFEMGSNAMSGSDLGMGMNNPGDSLLSMDDFGGQSGGNMGMGNQGMNNFFGGGRQATPPNVQSVQFPNLQSGGQSYEQGNIGLLMDVYMEMTVELGRTKKLIKEILGIGEGTIIELDKLAGEPVDILVNHKLIAKGEVVVIDENFGVRVTEIVSPMERMGDIS